MENVQSRSEIDSESDASNLSEGFQVFEQLEKDEWETPVWWA